MNAADVFKVFPSPRDCVRRDPKTNLFRVYVGWSARGVRMDLLDPPKAPANYKDQAAIDRYVQEQTQKQQALAAHIPGVASLEEVEVLDADGKSVASWTDPRYGQVARKFYDFLCENRSMWRAYPSFCWGTEQKRMPWVAARHATTLARIVAYELMALATEGGFAHRPVSVSQLIRDDPDQPMFVDPLLATVPSEVRQHLSLQSVLNLWFERRPEAARIGRPFFDANACYNVCNLLGDL